MAEMIETPQDFLGMALKQNKAIAESMERLYIEMKSTNEKTEQRFAEIEEIQESLKKNVTLTRGELARLKRLILAKSKPLTHQFFKEPVSEELFEAKRGHTISYLWTILKTKYDVGTYPEISHIHFDEAMNTVQKTTIDDFPKAYYRLTPKMKNIAGKEIEHVEFLEDSEMDLFE